MPERPRLSVVCPAYQEEEVLPRFHAALAAAIDPLAAGYDLEVLYVDDGSRDRTLGAIRGLAATDPRVRYVSLSRNFGKEAALVAGLEHAAGDAVVTLDSDLQHPPGLIPDLVARWRDGADLIVLYRAEECEGRLAKRVGTALFYRLLGWLSAVPIRPSSTDYCLMSRPAVDAMVRLTEAHRYTPGLVRWLGFTPAELPFVPAPRAAGRTRFPFRALVRLATNALMSFSPSLARTAAGVGLALTGVSLVLSLAAVALLVPLAEPAARVGLVVLTAAHVLAACGLAAAGVLGEYAARIYDQAKGRPVYVVKEATADAGHGVARLPRAA
ncbi:MAG TPA: glycosyltransferase family 2 protein [Urbifossiella sp.]|nr:glycosyltransferase family 2 protein [Urbifossiella sp.]